MCALVRRLSFTLCINCFFLRSVSHVLSVPVRFTLYRTGSSH
ncbi:hypothetical protein DDI_4547 [Dickeya dianthicola RNS04.9]|nr:hypothetical protein DDI_4547 [Dickeya dianthicola RNS04.9]